MSCDPFSWTLMLFITKTASASVVASRISEVTDPVVLDGVIGC